ncbi:hypothetical protein BGZ70_001881 [Mortierella alpina]|uniref:Uncharacterized protein n=1 Tax=Mortierella alpina TaxID=64518 RepID=A0A9P6LXJ6_MORAP|nr:hypothetical protein BGZ70_001881 [Mortierella alpina]
MDYETAAGRIVIIQESSKDCELWAAASNAANTVGLALLRNQSSILLSIVTSNVLDETKEFDGDETFLRKIVAALRYIIHAISSSGYYVMDRISAAVTWLWEYSKAVTLIVGAAIAPIALNTASSLATKTVEFGVRCIYATTIAVMGIFYRLLRLSRRSKDMVQTSENQALAEETVETVQPRGMPAPERAPMDVKSHTYEITSTHPIFSIYFVGASFIAGLLVGGYFAVAVVAATRPTPV